MKSLHEMINESDILGSDDFISDSFQFIAGDLDLKQARSPAVVTSLVVAIFCFSLFVWL